MTDFNIDAAIQSAGFESSKQHQTAMAVQAMMSSVTELCSLACEGDGYEIVRQDLHELEIVHGRLALLLSALRQPVMQAAE